MFFTFTSFLIRSSIISICFGIRLSSEIIVIEFNGCLLGSFNLTLKFLTLLIISLAS